MSGWAGAPVRDTGPGLLHGRDPFPVPRQRGTTHAHDVSPTRLAPPLVTVHDPHGDLLITRRTVAAAPNPPELTTPTEPRHP